MTYPTIRSMLPRLVVPVAPLYHWIITQIIGLALLLGACFFGIYIQSRIDAHELSALKATNQVLREQVSGKEKADALTTHARKRDAGTLAEGRR